MKQLARLAVSSIRPFASLTTRESASAWARVIARIRHDIWEPPDKNFAPLDGLRGFASCIVVFYHCALFMSFYTPEAVASGHGVWVRAVSNGFWAGIDIFFVLSGFLIGRILISDLLASRRLYFPSFFLRRSFRIFPAHYLILTIALFAIAPLDLPVFHFLFGTKDWSLLLRESWANYFYVVNYVNPGGEPSILSWGWSLAVEEQFYLFLPPFMWLLFRSRSDAVHLAGLLACILLPFLGRGIQFALDPSIRLMEGFYYFSHNRFDEIFVGVLIAYLYVRHFEALRRFCTSLGSRLGWGGLVLIASVWIFGGLTREGAFAVVFQFLVMAMGTGLLVLNALFLDNGLTRFFAHRLWYPLSRISYGTYLIHPFVLSFLIHFYREWVNPDHFEGIVLLPFYVAVMAISSLLAAAMFEWMELPMLRLGARLSQRSREAQHARLATEAENAAREAP